MHAAKMSKLPMTPCNPVLSYSLEFNAIPLQFGLDIGAYSRKDNSPHCGQRDPEGLWQRGREKKDKEEGVSSPDSIMQVLCFLEMGADSDTTTFIVFQSQVQNSREDRLGRTH
jgi:hypothetical protein